MKMRDVETIHRFTSRFMEFMFYMKSCEWKVGDKNKKVVKKFLSSLSPRFDKVLVDFAETFLFVCLLICEYNMKSIQDCLEESVIRSVDVEENIHN